MKKSTKKLQNSPITTPSTSAGRTTRTSSDTKHTHTPSKPQQARTSSVAQKAVPQKRPPKPSNPHPGYHFILASRSPRRRELLAEAGYDFEVVPSSDLAEPAAIAGESPESLARRAALAKAMDVVHQLLPDGPDEAEQKAEIQRVVIGCDTVAVLDDKILGKPADREDARRILDALRGHRHACISGLCLWNLSTDAVLLQCEQTTLRMKKISDTTLEQYLDTNLWQGKAGAYGLQDGIDWAMIDEGSETNVVGLPMELLDELLTDF
ncbi:MAG: Maf family protein [Thermoguttaceae bacterium]|nr:Maf family protein [Thermoguttaceae bacterium]